MKKLIFALLNFALASPAFAGVPTPAIPGLNTISVCGQVLSTNNLIQLYCRVSGNQYCSFQTANGVGYTPSGSKAFRVRVMRAVVITGNSGTLATLTYQDNNPGWASATTFTNPVYFAGWSATGQGGFIPAANATVGNASYENNAGCVTTDFLVPNGKYVGTKGDGTNVYYAQVYGYEE